MTQKDKAELLRRLHEGPEILVLPNAWDAASARVVEAEGFSAVAASSEGIACTADERRPAQPQITASSPKAAMNSLNSCAPPALMSRDALKTRSPNIICAAATPAKEPTSCAPE